MADEQPVPVFTGAELALADTLILLMKVMAMHGVIEQGAIDAVFSDLIVRYRGQHLFTAAAMAEYLRHHTTDSDEEMTLARLRTLMDKTPEGNA
jgi:membrane-associated PAP2 superfamily phosphatase